MFALHALLADTVVLSGNLFGWHFAVTQSQLIYLLIAAIVGVIAEFIVGWRVPFGVIGAIIAALVGIWLLTDVIQLVIPGDPVIYGVPLFKALIGAILFVGLWHLLVSRRPRRRIA